MYRIEFGCCLLCLCFLAFSGNSHAQTNRSGSYPYLSGDTFRAHCDFIFDETQRAVIPSKVKKGDKIFVKTDYLDDYFKTIHPQIQNPYILVTHNSACSIPGTFSSYLEDETLIAWFGQNIESNFHEKLFPIPIGIANRVWAHGNVDLLHQIYSQQHTFSKKIFVYLNFAISTKPDVRSLVYNLFRSKPWCRTSKPKKFSLYLQDLAGACFVLSPRGMGLDCHRTWEALLMGAIPIVKRSSLDSMYEGLPVLIVDDWSKITKNFLEKEYKRLLNSSYKQEKLFADYWFEMMDSCAREYT